MKIHKDTGGTQRVAWVAIEKRNDLEGNLLFMAYENIHTMSVM